MPDPSDQSADSLPDAPAGVATIPAIDEHGNVVAVPAGTDPLLLSRQGLSATDDEGVRLAQVQQQYGGPGQQAIAGAEGVGAGLTAGWSRNAEVGLGITTPEAIAGREEANPITSGLSEFGGSIGGLALGDEAIEGIGALAAGTGAASKAVQGAGLGERMLQSAATMGAYSAGQTLSEETLGEQAGGPSMSIGAMAESALISGGLGAVIGAGTTGIFGLAGKALPASIKGAGGIISRLTGAGGDGLAKLSSLVTGKDAGDILELAARRGELDADGFQKLYGNDFTKAVKGYGGDVQDLGKFLEDTRKDARATQLDDMKRSLHAMPGDIPLRAAQAHLNGISDWVARARLDPELNQYTPILDFIDGEVQKTRGFDKTGNAIKAGFGAPNLVDAARSVADQLVNPAGAAWTDESFQTWHAMDALRDRLQNGMKYDANLTNLQQEAMGSARAVTRQVGDFTKNSALWGEAGTRWADWQHAEWKYIEGRDLLLQSKYLGTKGVTDIGEVSKRNFLDSDKAQLMLKAINANGDSQAGRVLDNYIKVGGDLNEAARDVYGRVPSKAFDPDKLQIMIDSMAEKRAASQEALRMGGLAKELGGTGGMGVGRPFIVGWGARMAGLPAGPVIGAYEAGRALTWSGRALTQPAGTIESFARLERAISKMQKAIPASAKSAVQALTGVGEKAAIVGAYKLARDHMLTDPAGAGADKKDWHKAAVDTARHVQRMGSDLPGTAASVSHALAPLPPKTRYAAIPKAMGALAALRAASPATNHQGQLGPVEPDMSSETALRYARTAHVVSKGPLALAEYLKQGELKPSDVATALGVHPETTKAWQAAVTDEFTKVDRATPAAKAQIATALGQPAWPASYLAAMQAPNVGAPPPQMGGPVKASEAGTKRFKSKLGNMSRLPSQQEVE